MAEFDAEACERCAGIDDEPTVVAGVLPTLVRISGFLSRTLDTDRMGHGVVVAPCPGLTESSTWHGLAELTAGQRPLHWRYASSSRAAVHPRWNTASWVIKSNASPLGL